MEPNYSDARRSDLSLVINNQTHFIELKTPNTSWCMVGVATKTRPITKNINSIIEDAYKLRAAAVVGIVAFVLFPVPCGDCRWLSYLKRIASELGISLTEAEHCSSVQIESTPGDSCEAIVCCFQP